MSECSHYIRKCSFLTPCCGKIYMCRFCHDHNEKHKLDRESVEFIICLQCSKRQLLGTHCIDCGLCFGVYACLKCRLFDNADKEQFHCSDCGVCHTGGAANFFHCSTCKVCYKKAIKKTHKCKMIKMNTNKMSSVCVVM